MSGSIRPPMASSRKEWIKHHLSLSLSSLLARLQIEKPYEPATAATLERKTVNPLECISGRAFKSSSTPRVILATEPTILHPTKTYTLIGKRDRITVMETVRPVRSTPTRSVVARTGTIQYGVFNVIARYSMHLWDNVFICVNGEWEIKKITN